MAKQSGIHQLKGKVRGMSYYRQKGVDDGLARAINQGMSERVKNDDGYANTRLNAAEFGSAGSFAGACIRMISERQRTMLKDFATGELAKAVKRQIVADSVNEWGKRMLPGIDWQEEMLQRISGYAKNDFQSEVGGTWPVAVSVEGSNATWEPNAQLPQGWGFGLGEKGVEKCSIEMYAYRIELLASAEGSAKGFGEVALIASNLATVGESVTLTTPATIPASFDGAQKDNVLTGVLVVIVPMQVVNGKNYPRQELCTFKLLPVQTA